MTIRAVTKLDVAMTTEMVITLRNPIPVTTSRYGTLRSTNTRLKASSSAYLCVCFLFFIFFRGYTNIAYFFFLARVLYSFFVWGGAHAYLFFVLFFYRAAHTYI
eukprot:Rmarinus@m.6340